MAYDMGELTDLIDYHLVLGEDTDAAADGKLAELVRNIEEMFTRPLWQAAERMACDGCAWVVTDLIGPDGAGVADNDGFYCSTCRWDGEI